MKELLLLDHASQEAVSKICIVSWAQHGWAAASACCSFFLGLLVLLLLLHVADGLGE